MRPNAVFAALLGIAVSLGCDDCETEDSTEEPEPERSQRTGASGQQAGGGFQWTRTPELPSVPEGPVRGMANGHEFEAESIFFEPRFDRWALVVTDAELEEPTAIKPPGAQALTITDLPRDLKPGVYRRSMTQMGGSYWQIENPDGPGIANWTASNAYVLQITEWAVEPWKPEKGLFQKAGHASGKIAVVYEASGGHDRSWIAGTFEDVVVRYMGKPHWAD